MGFDTSLFAENDPQLAKQVESISVYFDGMEEVRISSTYIIISRTKNFASVLSKFFVIYFLYVFITLFD